MSGWLDWMSYMRNMNYESNNIYTVVDNAFDLHLVIIIKAIYFKVKEDKYNNNIVFKFTFKLSVPIKKLKHIILFNIDLKQCPIINRDEYLADVHSSYKIN